MNRFSRGLISRWASLGPRFLPFADAATAELPLSRLLRLALFQVSVGMALVLLVGTLNRVMIVELHVSTTLVAMMVALPVLYAPMRALIGFRSDTHRSALGWRRVPYIWMGSMLQFGGLAIMPFALIILSGDTNGPAWLGHLAAALAFLLVGAGLHTTQTAGLALAADLAPADKRPRVVALLYTMLLVGMLGVYFGSSGRTFDILSLAKENLPLTTQRVCFALLFVGFGVFTALFPFHTWVPDGHSSAPTAGSMFLAGISMKLGGYGCLRVATYLLPQGAQEYATAVIILSVIAILYGAFATMMQKDLKYINAYSSVSHCGFVLLGIGMLTKTSMTGAVMQMVSHGLMTALFFAIIGMIYERTHTRQVSEMGGLLKTMPFISTVLFIVGLCSLGLPGLSGFVAEMTVFMGSWQNPDMFSRVATILACLSIVVTAVYILGAVARTAMGPIRNDFKELPDARWNEKLAALILIIGILAIGTAPFWLNDLINPATEIIKQKLMAPVPID